MARAYSVKSLAAEWECGERQIMSVISAGKLHAFWISPTMLRIPGWAISPETRAACQEAEPDHSPLRAPWAKRPGRKTDRDRIRLPCAACREARNE